VVPVGIPFPVTSSPTAKPLVLDSPTVDDPLVTVPVRVAVVPGRGPVGAVRPLVVVKVYSAVPAAVLELIPSACVDIGCEPKPRARAATSAVEGAGQRRITASLLLELSARSSKARPWSQGTPAARLSQLGRS
jgi:hypothetical protein